MKALIAEHQVTERPPAHSSCLLRGRSRAAYFTSQPLPLGLAPPRPWSSSRFAGVSRPLLTLLPLGPIRVPPPDGLSLPALFLKRAALLRFVPRPAPPRAPDSRLLSCSLVHVCIVYCLLSASHRLPPVLQTHHLSGNIRSHSKRFRFRFGNDGHHTHLLFAHAFP